jgi:hypothetical protein
MKNYITPSADFLYAALLVQRLIVGLLAAAFSMNGAHVVAQEGVISREYAIKAGVIGLLGKCVTWPEDVAPSPGDPLKIGILGKDPFFENGVNQLDRAVAEENLKGGNIIVKRFHSANDYEPCHILFVSRLAADGSAETMADRIKAARQITDGTTVLLMGESTGVAHQGAIANLLFDRTTNLIRLEINPDAAARARLKLSPDLLRLKLVMIVRDPQVRK